MTPTLSAERLAELERRIDARTFLPWSEGAELIARIRKLEANSADYAKDAEDMRYQRDHWKAGHDAAESALAAARERLVVDDAMVTRAMNAVWPGWQSDDEKSEQRDFMWKALRAALAEAGQ